MFSGVEVSIVAILYNLWVETPIDFPREVPPLAGNMPGSQEVGNRKARKFGCI